MYELTGKTIEVMVYGDGAFKDPVGKIWELADPVVSPFFTFIWKFIRNKFAGLCVAFCVGYISA